MENCKTVGLRCNLPKSSAKRAFATSFNLFSVLLIVIYMIFVQLTFTMQRPRGELVDRRRKRTRRLPGGARIDSNFARWWEDKLEFCRGSSPNPGAVAYSKRQV